METRHNKPKIPIQGMELKKSVIRIQNALNRNKETKVKTLLSEFNKVDAERIYRNLTISDNINFNEYTRNINFMNP